MVTGILTIIHVLICLVLVVIVLMQSQQSMNISGMFGGASQSALGNKPQSVLSRATTILAIVFMLTSVIFAMWPSQRQGALDSGQGGQTAPPAQRGAPGQGGQSAGQQDAQSPAGEPTGSPQESGSSQQSQDQSPASPGS